MKKSATSNYAGFISIDKQPKKVTPSVKSARGSSDTLQAAQKVTPGRKNGETVLSISSGSSKRSTTKVETKTQSKMSVPSAASPKSRGSTGVARKSSQDRTTSHQDTKPGKTAKPDAKRTTGNEKASKDIGFVSETQNKFKKINEKLVNDEKLQAKRKDKKSSPSDKDREQDRPRTQTKLSHTDHESDRPKTQTKISQNQEEIERPKRQTKISHTEQFENTLIVTDSRLEPSTDDKSNTAEEDMDYEDDFEDYESDFESFSSSLEEEDGDSFSINSPPVLPQRVNSLATSNDHHLKVTRNVEEEKKLDSGVYELTPTERRQKTEMQNIKKAIEEENARILTRFQGPEEDPGEDSSLDLSHRFTFINFEEALKLENKKKKSAKRKKRSDYLLDMITLDRTSFVIYECPPIPYEMYIKCYGRSNTQQVLVQTNDDNLDEETQTESIIPRTKWTQCPLSFTLSTTGTLEKLKTECSGVGTAEEEDQTSGGVYSRFAENHASLYQFVEKFGQIMLSLLEEEDQYRHQSSNEILQSGIFENNTRDLKFSDQFINLKVDHVPFLTGRPISHTLFCRRSDLKLITVHQKPSGKVSSSSELLNRCMVGEWNITQPSAPLSILVANSDVTCVECEHPHVVFGGMRDGSLSVWDLSDRTPDVRSGEVRLRPPSYNTATIVKESLQACGPVVSLRLFHENMSSDTEPNQIFSLHQSGTILLWTIFRSTVSGWKSKNFSSVDLGQSYWSDVRLILLKILHVSPTSRLMDLECTCMTVFNQDIFVGTSRGVVHHLSVTSAPSIPSSYLSNTEEQLGVKCIEHCPHDREYFLVGFSKGQIKLYNRKRERPLISFAGTGNPGDSAVDVRCIGWSQHRLGLFFVLDSDARLHMWDLCKSDMYPLYSISLQSAQVTNLDLSPCCERRFQSSFLVLGTSSGHVEVHRIRKELGKQSDAEFKKDKNKFMKYVSIL